MKRGQIFGIATYDALFKWVLSADSIRPSFFHAFIPGIAIQSSERLDEHMNPWQELQLLRDAIHHKNTTELVTAMKETQPKIEVHVADTYHSAATNLLKALIHHFEDIQYSFPQPLYEGKMDFVCRLDTGEYALVEMQVFPEDQWDQRALAYVASYFGNQLRKGGSWKNIRKVIGVNILGGAKEQHKHWPDTPQQYVRHYKFQEQIHTETPPRHLEGLDIIQYALANVPKELDSQEQKDWLRFFKDAHNMTEEDVKNEIKTSAVLEAFERAKLVSLPEAVRESYQKEELKYDNLSTYIAKERAEGQALGRSEGEALGRAEGEALGRAEGEALGRAEGEALGRAEGEAKLLAEKYAIAQALLKRGLAIPDIQVITGLPENEICKKNHC